MQYNFIRSILGEQRLNCFDAGASYFLTDNWTILLEALGANIYLADPNSDALEYIPETFKQFTKLIPHCLAESQGVRQLYIANILSGTSLCPPCGDQFEKDKDDSYFYPLRVKEIKTKTLSNVLDDYNEDRIDLIKLDTQGSELEILRGLDIERMNKLLAIEIEVQFKNPQKYRGACQLYEIQQYLHQFGMEISNIKAGGSERPEKHYSDLLFNTEENKGGENYCLDKITEVDILFTKEKHRVLNAKDKGLVCRYIAILCVFYLFTNALSLTGQKEFIDLFSKSESEKIIKSIKLWADHHINMCKSGFAPLWVTDSFKDDWRNR